MCVRVIRLPQKRNENEKREISKSRENKMNEEVLHPLNFNLCPNEFFYLFSAPKSHT